MIARQIFAEYRNLDLILCTFSLECEYINLIYIREILLTRRRNLLLSDQSIIHFDELI